MRHAAVAELKIELAQDDLAEPLVYLARAAPVGRLVDSAALLADEPALRSDDSSPDGSAERLEADLVP
ncbi:MAG: hypothetical protein WA252_07945 [Candidatus Sulfotelmatobacter sp.]